MQEIPDILKCPFCLIQSTEAKSGATKCPECGAKFQIDDRLGSISGDTDNPRLPTIGTICTSCGLLQVRSHQNCSSCGAVISTAVE